MLLGIDSEAFIMPMLFMAITLTLVAPQSKTIIISPFELTSDHFKNVTDDPIIRKAITYNTSTAMIRMPVYVK